MGESYRACALCDHGHVGNCTRLRSTFEHARNCTRLRSTFEHARRVGGPCGPEALFLTFKGLNS